jgi:hypothetical protein
MEMKILTIFTSQMKNYCTKTSLCFFLVIPLFVMGQKTNEKDIAKLRKLGVSIDTNLRLSYSQSNRIISIWDSVYDIGTNQ